jgi:hypothetical protein
LRAERRIIIFFDSCNQAIFEILDIIHVKGHMPGVPPVEMTAGEWQINSAARQPVIWIHNNYEL